MCSRPLHDFLQWLGFKSPALGRLGLRLHVEPAFQQTVLGSFLWWFKGRTEGRWSKRVADSSPAVTGNVGYIPLVSANLRPA